ncbi:MAG: amidohydrolase family protein, partial [Verrucomicrobia bacterium]|nr:amidohydrolase family protein [Verrucomicrobiota bacterium]
IHCHSYRQDEILMLIRLMESFNVRVGTFQHVLEGYKVADEIARHGAGASGFSDWWAYKFEVYDAIPQNGSLMRERGVTVSFNSDSSELARRLYVEAAKAVKYGGTSEMDALKFVTLNPAKQLRIDSRVGSLETGKDADFAIWSGSPLDSGSVCLQTWVDGKKYFDRAAAAERAAHLDAERQALLAKARKCESLAGGGSGQDSPPGANFFDIQLEKQFEGRDRHCLEEER